MGSTKLSALSMLFLANLFAGMEVAVRSGFLLQGKK
jgi:hypothetical protein